MTITIYGLLGMFKKGKFPKKIRIYDCVYIYDEDKEDYIQDGDLTREHLFKEYKINDILDDEVEILEEENKIEKLYHCCMESDNEEINFLIKNINGLSDKFNEVIDEINKLKEDK